ncbi:hypothetical protein [Peribacillus frigoritolerans]
MKLVQILEFGVNTREFGSFTREFGVITREIGTNIRVRSKYSLVWVIYS